MLRKQKGQSVLEYALIIAVVVAGLIAMQIYMKRGIQGKLRSSTDEIGAQFDAGKTNVTSSRSHTSTTVETLSSGVTNVSTADTTPEVTTTSGSEAVGNLSSY